MASVPLLIYHSSFPRQYPARTLVVTFLNSRNLILNLNTLTLNVLNVQGNNVLLVFWQTSSLVHVYTLESFFFHHAPFLKSVAVPLKSLVLTPETVTYNLFVLKLVIFMTILLASKLEKTAAIISRDIS